MTRRKPTIQTIKFYCPRCGYEQKGYFSSCPVPGCAEARMREFVATMQQRIARPTQ